MHISGEREGLGARLPQKYRPKFINVCYTLARKNEPPHQEMPTLCNNKYTVKKIIVSPLHSRSLDH